MADYLRSAPNGDPHLDLSRLTREQTAALAEVAVEDYVDGRGAQTGMPDDVAIDQHELPE